jgi:hypothetical protein
LTQSNRLLWIGFYPLLLAAQLGAVLVDQSYAGALRAQSPDLYSRITSGAADLLLLLLLPVLLAGAISLGVSVGRSRLLVCVSLAILSLNVALPMLSTMLTGSTSALEQAGPLLRIAVQLGTLLFALLAVRAAMREVK